jgi:hypothetical protein
VNNQPQLVEKIIDDATGGKVVVDKTGQADFERDYGIITTTKLINGKWVKSVRRQKIKEE